MTEAISDNLTSILRLVRALKSAVGKKEVYSAEEILRIEVTCAELALLSIDTADSVREKGASGAERILNRELSAALDTLSQAALTQQNWQTLKNDQYISALLNGNVERISDCAARIAELVPDAVPPAPVPEDPGEEDRTGALMILAEPSGADSCELLKMEIRLLREQLAALVTERDDLKNFVCPRLKAEYSSLFGMLEWNVSGAELEMRYERRRLEMIRAAVNRQEVPSEETVSAQLAAEYEAYRKKLDDWYADVVRQAQLAEEQRQKEAERRESGTDPESKTEKAPENIKTIYRRIVKAMHPDLHPNQTEQEKELFRKAIAAYEAGDLHTLQMIDQMIGGSEPAADGQELLEQLLAEKNRLLALIIEVMKELKAIRSTYPYLWKELLADPDQIAARQASLRKRFEDASEAARKYHEEAEALLKTYGQ